MRGRELRMESQRGRHHHFPGALAAAQEGAAEAPPRAGLASSS